jgi:hypothetical protein
MEFMPISYRYRFSSPFRSQTAGLLLLSALSTSLASAQSPNSLGPKTIACNEATGCTHRIIDGIAYKYISANGLVIGAGMVNDGSHIRAIIGISNNTQGPIDIIPSSFLVEALSPKQKTLKFMPPEKIAKSAEHRAGWANGLSAFGAALATQQNSTETTLSGTVDANSSDGTTGSWHLQRFQLVHNVRARLRSPRAS